MQTAAQFPDAGVGLVVQRGGVMPEHFQTLKECGVAALFEPAIEEHMRGRENRRTVHVMLYLAVGLITHPHRTHAAVAIE